MDRLLEATIKAERRHFWFAGFRGFVRPLLRDATTGVARPRLLDCGCGTGAHLELLGEFGRVIGFDRSATGLSLAQQAGRRSIARATVTAVPFPDTSFDVVCSFDVIYSLEEADAARALAEMYRVLRPGGAVIVNVAALNVLHGSHSRLSEELRRYTRPQLRAGLERAGFRVTRLTYTNATLFPLMLAARTAQRLFSSSSDRSPDISVPPAAINAVLKGILRVEAEALNWMDMPVGSSLLCLARK